MDTQARDGLFFLTQSFCPIIPQRLCYQVKPGEKSPKTDKKCVYRRTCSEDVIYH